MAVSKPMRNQSALYSEGVGKAPNIEMPPIGYVASGPNDFNDTQQTQPQNNPFGSVPDELPQEVKSAIAEQQEVEPQEEQQEQYGQPQQPQYQAQEQDEQDDQEPVKVTPQRERFKNIREAKERAERERDALMAQIIQMQQANNRPVQNTNPAQEVEPEEDFDFDIDDETLVEGKHAKKILQELQKVKKEMRKYQSQSEGSAVEARIKANFPDFDQVVSKENVEILNYEFPEIAQSLRDTPNFYNKAVAAYSVIKRFGIGQEKEDLYAADKAKAIANAKKPRPLASAAPQQGDSPLSKANAFANGLTEEMKAQLRKEMFGSMKRN